MLVSLKRTTGGHLPGLRDHRGLLTRRELLAGLKPDPFTKRPTLSVQALTLRIPHSTAYRRDHQQSLLDADLRTSVTTSFMVGVTAARQRRCFLDACLERVRETFAMDSAHSWNAAARSAPGARRHPSSSTHRRRSCAPTWTGPTDAGSVGGGRDHSGRRAHGRHARPVDRVAHGLRSGPDRGPARHGHTRRGTPRLARPHHEPLAGAPPRSRRHAPGRRQRSTTAIRAAAPYRAMSWSDICGGCAPPPRIRNGS